MAGGESGSWGSWGQAWGGASSWGGSSWFDEPDSKTWNRTAWSSHQPQEEPATFGEPWASREVRASENKVEELAKVPVNDDIVDSSAKELAEERRRRIEAEAALAEERSSRERSESELRLRVEDLERRLAAAETSAREAANARAAAEADTAILRTSAEAANAEVERLKASAVASAEAMRERTAASAEDWWMSNAVDGSADSWRRGWSSSTWSSPSDANSWHRWGAWSSQDRHAENSTREVGEVADQQHPDSEASEGSRLGAREEAEPESESAPEIARQEEKRHPHENEEWYQKWLRRQRSDPRHTVEAGKPEEKSSSDQQQHAEGSTDVAASQRSDDGRQNNEEWYQKWLRRQENRPRKIVYIGADQSEEPREEAPQSEEPQPQLEEEQAVAVDAHSSGESQAAPPEDNSKAYQNEEWYQKWLRRQKNKPRQVIELGVEKPQEQDGSQKEAQASQEVETTASPSSQPEEAGKRGYENEEWYQKWLRRQKNKGREIIEIGVEKPQEPEEPEDPAAERRLDPDDSKIYTWSAICRKYKGHFPDDEIKAYWENDCKVEANGETAAASSETEQKEEATDQKAEDVTTNEASDNWEATPSEPEKKPYEQEEWYQKWLRRQANKDRKIIEIG